MYVPPYARFVYGPTKCYFVHMCEFMCVKRFNKNVFMQCFRQAYHWLTTVEYVILRLKSKVYEDWVEEKPCSKKCVWSGCVSFGDLRAVLSDLIELWPSIRLYIRYTGHAHLKVVVEYCCYPRYLAEPLLLYSPIGRLMCF